MAAIYPVPTERPSKVRILGHDLTQQGFRWSVEIAEKLESASFGMLCITADNLDAPWLLFEAGALAKKLNRPNVCPYLIDLKPSDLQGPLSQFQACESTKADTLKLLHSMNEALSQRALPIAQIDRAFDKWWPDFEIALSAKHTSAVIPSNQDMNCILYIVNTHYMSSMAFGRPPGMAEPREMIGYMGLRGFILLTSTSTRLPMTIERTASLRLKFKMEVSCQEDISIWQTPRNFLHGAAWYGARAKLKGCGPKGGGICGVKAVISQAPPALPWPAFDRRVSYLGDKLRLASESVPPRSSDPEADDLDRLTASFY